MTYPEDWIGIEGTLTVGLFLFDQQCRDEHEEAEEDKDESPPEIDVEAQGVVVD
jgi:hypothetical protein